MPSLPTLDIHFSIRVEGLAPDLPFLGPTVRGLLGYGLRQTCCGHSPDREGRCVMGEACAYAYLFEGPIPRWLHEQGLQIDAMPQPFQTLVAPPAGHSAVTQRRVQFGIRLFGTATALAPQVARAIVAREPHGFGARSHGFRVESIARAGEIVWRRADDPERIDVEGAIGTSVPSAGRTCSRIGESLAALAPDRSCVLRLRFETPLSLGAPVRAHGDWPTRLIDAALRRHWLLEQTYAEAPGSPRSRPRSPRDAHEFRTVAADVTPFVLARRSTRHGRLVRLAGVTGQVEIEGPWHRYRPLLEGMEAYGLGQSTTFGFGRIALEARTGRHSVANTIPAPHTELPRWLRLRGPQTTVRRPPRLQTEPPRVLGAPA